MLKVFKIFHFMQHSFRDSYLRTSVENCYRAAVCLFLRDDAYSLLSSVYEAATNVVVISSRLCGGGVN